MTKKLLGLMVLSLLATGCITTRGTIAEEQERQQTQLNISNLREGNASLEDRMSELQDQFRELNGRIELTESRYQGIYDDEQMQSAQLEEKWKAFSGRFDLLLTSMSQLEDKVSEMSDRLEQSDAKVDGLEKRVKAQEDRAKQAAAAAAAAKKKATAAPVKKRGNYAQAEVDFSNKKWKEAALGYQRYRELNPKGKRYERATYRMGLCFKNLKLKSEAKVFFSEVVDRFPKGEYFARAQAELKKL